jgi:hypothetical protein
MQRDGPPADEVAIAKAFLVASLSASFEPLLSRARTLVQWRSPARPEDLYDPAREVERVRSLDAEQLRSAAVRHLSRERRIVVYTTRATDVQAEGLLRSREGSVNASVESDTR